MRKRGLPPDSRSSEASLKPFLSATRRLERPSCSPSDWFERRSDCPGGRRPGVRKVPLGRVEPLEPSHRPGTDGSAAPGLGAPRPPSDEAATATDLPRGMRHRRVPGVGVRVARGRPGRLAVLGQGDRRLVLRHEWRGSAVKIYPGPPGPARLRRGRAGARGGGRGGSRLSTSTRFLGVMLVYAGIVLMLGAWFELVRTVRRQPSIPMARLVAILVAWVAPVLVRPPVFSRDVYSYAAQGEMVQRGLNPYIRTPSALRGGRFLDLVDPLWRHAPAPYGPAWERLSGAIVALSHHDVWLAAAGFRLVALAGLGLIAWAVPSLARSIGRPRSVAFALAALNPVVLLVLVGGPHNAALMLGVLVAGCALGRRL